MGTLRKMGAFLGLVPDDQRFDGEHGYADDHAADPYRSVGYQGDDDYDRSDGYGSDHRGTDIDGEYSDAAVSADYRAGYESSGYRSEFADGGPLDDANEPAYAGYRDSADDAGYRQSEVPEPAYAAVAAEAAPSARQEPVKATRSSRGSKGHRGRSNDDEYHIQGALAVQPQSYQVETPVEASSGKPVTVKLAGFGDARQVGETYRDGQSVILDMTDLTDSEARRMVDFAAGLAFAVHGSIDKVTTKVFMLHQPTGDQAR
jgi:cell division inhibitor SepF